MIVFFYEKVRLKRGVWQTVSIVLLIAFLCAFFTLFDGFICQKEQDMESAYAVIPVTVVVSNLTGTKTDDLKITDSFCLSKRLPPNMSWPQHSFLL